MKHSTSKSKAGSGINSTHKRVSEELRDKILGGTWKPGDILPTIHELADQFSTSYFTVQTALTPLVEEGLLERKRRVGTMVKHHADVLNSVGIYCGGFLLDSREDAFVIELCRQLRRLLTMDGVQVEMFMETRSKEEQREVLPSLKRAVDQNEVQAIIAARVDHHTLPWLTQLPITKAFTSGAPLPYSVKYDTQSLFRLSLQHLRDCGCEKVGLICSTHKTHESERYETKFYSDYYRTVKELGLRTKPEWSDGPENWQSKIETFGYHRFHSYWKLSEKPQGLLVYPDTAARGVLTAALELGVQIPEDIQMVVHRNVGVEWVSPLPVTWIESDVERLAKVLIEQTRKQKDGKKVTAEYLPYEIREACEVFDNTSLSVG